MNNSKDLHRAFPGIVDNFASYGKVYPVVGGDGVVRTGLSIPGSLNGAEGSFQYIIESSREINHRLFLPNY